MSTPPAGMQLTRLASPTPGSGQRHRATVLRAVAVVLLVVAVVAAVVWVGVAVTDAGAPGLAGWLVGLPASVLCPAVAALVAYAAARVARREATEQVWLAGTSLVVTDEVAGRREYDLTTVPVEFRLRSLLARAGQRPVWAELHVGADPVDRWVLVLTELDTRQARPAAELLALAAALDRSTHPGARLAAGRLRTLASWGGLAPLGGTDTEDVPVTPPPGAGPATPG